MYLTIAVGILVLPAVALYLLDRANRARAHMLLLQQAEAETACYRQIAHEQNMPYQREMAGKIVIDGRSK